MFCFCTSDQTSAVRKCRCLCIISTLWTLICTSPKMSRTVNSQLSKMSCSIYAIFAGMTSVGRTCLNGSLVTKFRFSPNYRHHSYIFAWGCVCSRNCTRNLRKISAGFTFSFSRKIWLYDTPLFRIGRRISCRGLPDINAHASTTTCQTHNTFSRSGNN